MRLRRATPADIPQMRQLEQHSATAAHWSAAQYDALFRPDVQTRVALIADQESADVPIQGLLIARCLPDEWEIENIIVEERDRQRGVGSSLVRGLLAEARTFGAASVILEVRESNRSAMRLYESIGFKLEGRRKDYYHDPAEDALLYRITITDL
ncbi:MAG TPA: GNAT family N-acetyltransferase [Terriglobales bacterium]